MEPLPRPQYERTNMCETDQRLFWEMVFRQYTVSAIREGSLELYLNNRVDTPYEGELP